MTFAKRIRIIFRTTRMIQFMIIALIYGVVFGGFFSNIGSGFDLKRTAFAAVGSTLAYGLIFLWVMIIMFLAMGTKLVMSLSLARQEVRRIWIDLNILIYFITIGSLLVLAIFAIKEVDSQMPLMVLGKTITFDQGVSNYTFVAASLLLVVFFIQTLLNLISLIGASKGWMNCLSVSLFSVAGLFFLLPSLIDWIQWGNKGGLLLAIFGVLSLVFSGISHQLLMSMEVDR